MILVKPSFEIMEIMGVVEETLGANALRLIEMAGRTCYKSTSPLTFDSAEKFVKKINDLGHESVIEHSAMTVKFIVDRGVTHELVRHRLCAFSQESTRYCNYKGGVCFVIPPWVDIKEGIYNQRSGMSLPDQTWAQSMHEAEIHYIHLLNNNWSPQQARSVLPNSTKAEIVVTANFREWKHIFRLRCSKRSHPQMREVMIPLLKKAKTIIPVIFDNITY